MVVTPAAGNGLTPLFGREVRSVLMIQSAGQIGESDLAQLDVLFVQAVDDAEIATDDGGGGVADVEVALGPAFDSRRSFEHADGPRLVEVDAIVGQGEREHFSRATELFRRTGGGQQRPHPRPSRSRRHRCRGYE